MNNDNLILKKKIELFRIKFLNKEIPYKFQPSFIDILLGNLIRLIYLNFFKVIKKIIIETVCMIKNLKSYYQNVFQNFKNLENKINSQEKIIEQSLSLNSKLHIQIHELKNKLDLFVENKKKSKEEITNNQYFKNFDTREEFYQNENLRLSNQLHEMKKKYEILKNEISKFENQRSNMIKKINSLNNEIEDSNILTNVFDNSYKKNKIDIIDHGNISNSKNDLNEQVRNIFSKK